MAPAADGLRAAIAAVAMCQPRIPVLANASAEPVASAADAARLLVAQLTTPVRWVDCMRAADRLAPGATYVEVGPGNVLSGLVKRVVPGAATITLGTADDLERFLA